MPLPPSHTHPTLDRCVGLQVIASLPRGATRRLYTAPHSLLDTFPTQLPRQLLDSTPDDTSPAAATPSAGNRYQQHQPGVGLNPTGNAIRSTNVLLARARVSPVSSGASSHSSESAKAAEQQHTAEPAQRHSANSPSIETAADGVAASNHHSLSTFPATHHGVRLDPVCHLADSSFQFPAGSAPSMPDPHTAPPTAAELREPFPPVEPPLPHETVLAQRDPQENRSEAGQETRPLPDSRPQADSGFTPAASVAGDQSGVVASDRHTGCAVSPQSPSVAGGWCQRNSGTAGNVQAGPQQASRWTQATGLASNPAEVS